MSTPTFKDVILARYCGEFQQADEKNATVRKTSEDIVFDLRPMAEFSTTEIAEHMVGMGYSIGFDDSTPVWLMTRTAQLELKE